ncbi:tetratricopeptide repeat protein [Singulisphaera sp. PoT]|uniref:tetratricopeptide repeat protein n=1 Tax=Singulisphaera sp. PoT TaxID=3411797 RepID=UPI003BF60B52
MPNRPIGDNLGVVNRQAAMEAARNRAQANHIPPHNPGINPNIQNRPNLNNNVNINRPGMINRPTNINNNNIRNNINNANIRNNEIIHNNVRNNTNVVNNNVNRNNVNVNRNNVNVNRNQVTNITNVTNVTQNNSRNNFHGHGGQAWGMYGGGRPPGGYGGSNGFRGVGYGGWGGPSRYASYHSSWVNGGWNPNYFRSGWGSNRFYGGGGYGFGGGGYGYNNGYYGYNNNIGNSALGWGVGIGVAALGMSALFNQWGYSRYSNPYYVSPALAQPAIVVSQPVIPDQPPPVIYDYSQPIDPSAPPPPPEIITQAVSELDAARGAFKAGDYNAALAQCESALRKTPNDPMLHQFRAICLFAMQRYDEAAVPLYTVLTVGPGWDWTTLSGLYPSVDIYTQQLRNLEGYCDATPRAAAARFVLADLYLTQGHIEAAISKLREVVALQPQDRLSAQLIETLTPKPDANAASATPPGPVYDPNATNGTPPAQPTNGTPPEPPSLPTNPVPPKLVGTWTAKPDPSVTITLAMDGNKNFDWNVASSGQPNAIKGQATFDNDTLFLAPPDQPPMVGKVTWKTDRQFQFKALGGPDNDPGLEFTLN